MHICIHIRIHIRIRMGICICICISISYMLHPKKNSSMFASSGIYKVFVNLEAVRSKGS